MYISAFRDKFARMKNLNNRNLPLAATLLTFSSHAQYIPPDQSKSGVVPFELGNTKGF